MKSFVFKHKWLIFLAMAYLLPIFYSLKSIAIGSVPFWHDPARDLLHAWNNLSDPTLIGPPTGIEGIFYGPYWTWWLSIWQLVSKNPRFVILMSQAVPYLLVMPIVWYLFRKSLHHIALVSLWFLFMFAFSSYTNFLWNPHLSLIFLLGLIWVTTQRDLSKRNLFISGVLAGLVGNFHMSIGLITAITTVIFLSIRQYLETQKKSQLVKSLATNITFWLVGLLLTLTPFVVFELRHNFLQTSTFIQNFQTTVIDNQAANNLVGITGLELVGRYLTQAGRLLNMNKLWTYILTIASLVVIGYAFYQKKLSASQKLLTIFCLLFTAILFTVYGLTNNPVWDYHFIGVEVIFLCWFGLAATQNSWFRRLLLVWTIIIFGAKLQHIPTALAEDPLKIPSLTSKQTITELILADATETFHWEAYSNDWRTTDYEYLFDWLGSQHQYYESDSNHPVNLKYLIIPVTSQDIRDDFINYKSPKTEFTTQQIWVSPDHTEIIKRVRRKNEN